MTHFLLSYHNTSLNNVIICAKIFLEPPARLKQIYKFVIFNNQPPSVKKATRAKEVTRERGRSHFEPFKALL